MSLSAAGAEVSRPSHDPDRLLAGYRAARTQETLFDLRAGAGPPGPGCPGLSGARATTSSSTRAATSGRPGGAGRPHRGARPQRPGTAARVVRSLVDNDGISYIEVDRHGDMVTNGRGIAMPGAWYLDGIPLVLSASDWGHPRGRHRAALPPARRRARRPLRSAPGDHQRHPAPRSCCSATRLHSGCARHREPGRHQLFMLGCDVSRAADGRFLVNADWTQAPSGAGYAGRPPRRRHAIPDVYERIGPRPAPRSPRRCGWR